MKSSTGQFTRKSIFGLCIIVLGWLSVTDHSLAQNPMVTVSNLNDAGPGSLRDAIAIASPTTIISFAVAGTITLTNGELLITNDLTIVGPDAAKLVINGNNSNRVFEIASNATVSISGLSVTGGHAPDKPSYTYSYPPPAAGGGGAIYNAGSLSLVSCNIISNSAGNGQNYAYYLWPEGTFAGDGGSGGAIYNANVLSAIACTVAANSAGSGGPGGTMNYGNGHWAPTAGGTGGSGGAIYNKAILSLTNCTLSDNRAGNGGRGGVDGPPYYSGGSGGAGGSGGGIFSSGIVRLVACTLAQNSAGFGGPGGYPYSSSGNFGAGGGICNASDPSSAELLNTIVAGNRSDRTPDLFGHFNSTGHNLISLVDMPGTGFTNGINSDLVGAPDRPLLPLLGILQNNGGLTPTTALLHDSPALGRGDDALLNPPYNLTTDQRGFPRKTNGHFDIGAFAFQPITNPPMLISLRGSNSDGIQFYFTNETTGASFTVLRATNLFLPISNWEILGSAAQMSSGQFQFSELPIGDKPTGFYRVSSP